MRTQPDEKMITLERIARSWNAAGIRYAVAHGLENYPAAIGRDLDLLIDERDMEMAIRLAVQELQIGDYRITQPPNPWQAAALFAFGVSNTIEIDFIPRLFWGGVVLAEGVSNSLISIGPFKVDLWASFAKRVLLRVLYGIAPKAPWIDRRETEPARERCSQLFGKQNTQTLFDYLEAGDADNLKRLTPRLRRTLLRRALLRKPLSFLRMIPRWLSKVVKPFLMRRVPIVALVGPDGAGKSTVIECLRTLPPEVSFAIELRHWRPDLMPRLGSLFGKSLGVTTTTDGLILPRRTPGRFPVLRLAYYWLDFFAGHFIKDCPASNALCVVVYDRCALDMAVDPLRFGLPTPRGTRMLWRLIPKPDLVILLHDEPARIHARKPELPVEEIERQNARWLQFVAEGTVDAVIQVDTGPEEIAERLKSLILEKFIEMNGYPTLARQADVAWLRGILQGQD